MMAVQDTTRQADITAQALRFTTADIAKVRKDLHRRC